MLAAISPAERTVTTGRTRPPSFVSSQFGTSGSISTVFRLTGPGYGADPARASGALLPVGSTTVVGMSELRRPWFTLTKTGSVLPPALEIAVGLLGLVVQVLTLASDRETPGTTVIVMVVAVALIAQGVADLVWWGRDGRREAVRQG